MKESIKLYQNINKKIKVLIAGIAGASLGTEILKSLSVCKHYEIYGCDISNLAYGLFEDRFVKTFQIDRLNYVDNVISLCKKNGIKVIIPGAEEPTIILSDNRKFIEQNSIILVANNSKVISSCSDKSECFKLLQKLGFSIPQFLSIDRIKDLRRAKGFTNTEIADAIGVSLSSVNKVISNKAKPFMIGRVYEFLKTATPTYKLTESEKQKYIQDYCETIKN